MGFKKDIVHLPNFILLKELCHLIILKKDLSYTFGRLSNEKGLHTLIDAAKKMKFNLNIIGDGPLKGILQKKTKTYRNIRFLGYKSGGSLNDEIKMSMGVIIPSEWYENNPRSVIEAFALGKPVVGARIGGIPELVKEDKTGFTFEAGNSKDLGEKVMFLKNNPDKAREMGINARKFG